MGCTTVCLRALVILCNVLIAIIGLVLLAGGIFLLTSSQKFIDQYSTKFINSVLQQQPQQQQGNWTNSTGTSYGDEEPSLDFSAFISPFGIVLVVFGVFITLVGLAGIFGVCCSSRILLVIYTIVTVLLILAEIILTILFFAHVFDDQIRSQALYTLTEDYVGLQDLGQYSLVWNYIMIELQCCGLDSYEDFNSAKKRQVNEFIIQEDLPLNVSQTTPVACCKVIPNFQSQADLACAITPTNQTSNWQTGCWDKVVTVLLPYRTMAIGIISAIVVAQALLTLMAVLIAWRLRKTGKDL